MRGAGLAWGVALLLLMAVSGCGPREVSIKASLDNKEVRMGERAAYTIEVRAPSGTEAALDPPEFPPEGPLSIVEARTEERRGGWDHTYYIEGFEPGTHAIEGPTLRHRPGGSADWAVMRPPVLTLSVLAPDGPQDSLKDIEGPVPYARPWALYAAMAAAALAAIALVAWLIRRYLHKRRMRPAPMAPPIPPDVAALEALAALRAEGLPARGEFARHYHELSLILRRYIEGRFDLRAPEMTTEEFLSELAGGRAEGMPSGEMIGGFLRSADMVRFARAIPQAQEADRGLALVEGFVVRTGRGDAPPPGGGEDV